MRALGEDKQRSKWKLIANLAEASTITLHKQICCCCYRSAPCLVNPPLRAEVINPSRVLQRSMESILVPKFRGHLIGIVPVYVLCHLFFAISGRFSGPIGTVRKCINCGHQCCKLESKRCGVQRMIYKSSANAHLMKT